MNLLKRLLIFSVFVAAASLQCRKAEGVPKDPLLEEAEEALHVLEEPRVFDTVDAADVDDCDERAQDDEEEEQPGAAAAVGSGSLDTFR